MVNHIIPKEKPTNWIPLLDFSPFETEMKNIVYNEILSLFVRFQNFQRKTNVRSNQNTYVRFKKTLVL